MKTLKSFALSTLLAIGCVQTASAGLLAYTVDTTTDQLMSIDLSTGTTNVIGATGFEDVEGLAYHHATGTLYGVDDSSDQLLTFDLTTGAGTVVGSLGQNFSDVGLAFAADGTLYAGGDLSDSGLFSIDLLTGAATLIGDPSVSPFGLAFYDGVMYGVSDDCTGDDCLISVDLSDGSVTQIGSFGGLNADEGGLDVSASGQLWFLESDMSNVYTIDATTGLATAGASISCSPDCTLEGLAIVDVPEPTTLAIFGLGLLGFGLRARKA